MSPLYGLQGVYTALCLLPASQLLPVAVALWYRICLYAFESTVTAWVVDCTLLAGSWCHGVLLHVDVSAHILPR